MTCTSTPPGSRRVRTATVAGFIALVAVMSPVVVRAQFLHPKISSKQSTIRNVVILPAKVDVVRASMKGPEGMAAESELLSARVEKMVNEVLATKHVTTLSGPSSSSNATPSRSTPSQTFRPGSTTCYRRS